MLSMDKITNNLQIKAETGHSIDFCTSTVKKEYKRSGIESQVVPSLVVCNN